MAESAAVLTPDGFPGQRLLVLPRPLVARSRLRPVTDRLLVTDVGFFPHATTHGRHRPRGAPELIVIVCVDGSGSCDLEGNTLEIRAGTALIIPPHTPHLYQASGDQPWTIWWCHVTGADVPVLLAPFGRTRLVAITDTFRIVASLNRMVRQMERDETYPSLIAAAGDAWSLLTQLAVDHLSGGRGQVEPIRAAQDHLRERLAEPVSVPELSRLAGLSTSHFAALFRRATGGGIVAYVKSLRMARARELLDTTTLPISEIARAVGYSDPFYFARHFRSVNQLSPTDYRCRESNLTPAPEPSA